MDKEKAKLLLTRQIEATTKLRGLDSSAPDFIKWKRDTKIAIQQIFPKSPQHVEDFESIHFSCSVSYSGMPDSAWVNACQNGLAESEAILRSMFDEIASSEPSEKDSEKRDSFSQLVKLFERFHLIARQLRDRHDGRQTLEVEDEYDAQDLIHALLHMYFDDIRAEEWTPSYAGGSSRMDFLIKQEKIVVEVKKTRKGLGAKEVGEQLIVDIQKYQVHQDCKSLICFIYDPEGRIANPRGLENDLNKDSNGFKVRVLISPKGV